MEEMGWLVGWLGWRGVKVVQCSNQSAEGRDLLMGGKKCKGRGPVRKKVAEKSRFLRQVDRTREQDWSNQMTL